MTAVRGIVAPGYERVREAFARDLNERGDSGAAFAAMVDGDLVVDLWGGLADAGAGAPWQPHTAAVIFSGTKGMVATALMLMVDRGELDLDATAASYWPQFAAAGKEHITVRQLGSHAAGLPGAPPPIDLTDESDPSALAAQVAALEPFTEVGVPCYHAATFGLLAGELIRRIDGRSPGRFVAEEIAQPMGDLEIRIGLPNDDPMASNLARLNPAETFKVGSYPSDDPRFAYVYPAGSPDRYSQLEVEHPSWGGVATARGMAGMYGRLVGEPGPVHRATLERCTAAASEGDDPLTARPLRFGPTGYELAGTPSSLGPPADAFGHTGAGGSSHGGWPALRTGFSYVTVDLRLEAEDGRSAELLDSLHAAVTGR